MSKLLRRTGLFKIVIYLTISSVAMLTFRLAQAQDATQNGNHIGLVIVHGDGHVLTQCVAFSTSAINGYDLLTRSGLDLNIEAGGDGAAICRIDNEGCSYPQAACFCQCEGGACHYWSYWKWADNQWQYSSLGAANQIGHNGDVQGWRWGLGSVDSAVAPPAMAFSDICKVATSATVTATITSIATITPTATLSVTTTPTASPTTSQTPIPATYPPVATAIPATTATNLPLVATNTLVPTPTNVSAPLAAPTPVPVPGILAFSANPSTINAGEGVTLTWRLVNVETAVLRTANAEEVVANAGNQNAGSKLVTPVQTMVYTLVARSRGGEAVAQMTITVNRLASPTPTASSAITVTVAVAPVQLIATPTPTIQTTPTFTPTATLAPVRFDLTPPTVQAIPAAAADPSSQAQMQRLLLFGGILLALLLPVGAAALILLIRAIGKHL